MRNADNHSRAWTCIEGPSVLPAQSRSPGCVVSSPPPGSRVRLVRHRVFKTAVPRIDSSIARGDHPGIPASDPSRDSEASRPASNPGRRVLYRARLGRVVEYLRDILEAIGRTPLIRLNAVSKGHQPLILAKAEFLNPGGSVKDRIGIAMIDSAEKKGLLRPGGTIVEPTSGNTGLGLALVAALRGYRCIFTIPDKQSREKVNLLKAFGARVIVCPTAVAPDHPESYYKVAERLQKETPNSFLPNQYAN